MVVNRETLQAAIHEALRAWHGQEAPPKTLLDDLLLVQERREQLTREGNALTFHLATDHLLLEALDELERQDETAAQVLRWRFVDNNTLLQVAHRLHVSEHTVSRLQRAAIGQLASRLEEQEQSLRARRIQQLEARLPPPSYTRLFGIGARRDGLAEELLQTDGPRVIAVVGIGGIGKTALVDAATRAVIHACSYDNAIWLRYESRTMSGQSLTPEHAFDALLAGLAGRLGLTGSATSPAETLVAIRLRLNSARHLVVIDNLESEAVTDHLLNHLVGLAVPGKFLLTMRSRPPGQAAVRYMTLPELSLEDAAQLLRHYSAEIGVTSVADATNEDIARIYEVVGGNPLALKLVAGLLDFLPLGEVLEQLAHSRPGPVENLYRHIYWQTWRTLSKPAQALLQAMPLVAESGGEPGYLRAISGLDEDSFWSALQQLHARSLLEVRGSLDEKRYGVHRLTESFVRTEIVRWPEE